MIGGLFDLVEGLCGLLDVVDTMVTLFKNRRRAIITLSVLTIGALGFWLVVRSG